MVLNRGKPMLSFLRICDKYMLNALADAEHAGVLLFTLLLGGTIGIVQRAGGGLGLARLLASYMTSAASALSSAWVLCCMIFFDDYSSILIVGSSLSPVLPRMQLAPERLAFIIHTIGVLLASLSPISSWIGLQLGYVAGVYQQTGQPVGPFMATMATLPYRFFPLLLFGLVPLLLFTNKDLGPLANYPVPSGQPSGGDGGAEANGAEGEGMGDGPLAPKPGVPHRAINAALPFAAIAVAAFGGMLLDGAVKLRSQSEMAGGGAPAAFSLVDMLGQSDSIAALIWASTIGWVVSLGLVVGQGVLSLEETMDAWIEGMKDVLSPMIVLLLAWALGDVISAAKAADFLAGALQSAVPRWALPTLVTILAHVISYACGSSFGTMGIILPLVGPLATTLGGDDPSYLTHCIGGVIGGASFGNLCSPISDTTILTVLATKCDLHAHIATITPYCLLCAALAIIFGSLPVGLGWYGPFTGLGLGSAALVAIVLTLGKTPPTTAITRKAL